MALTMLGAGDVLKERTDDGSPVVTITVQITLTGGELPAAASRLVSGLEALMATHHGVGQPGGPTAAAAGQPAGSNGAAQDRSIALAATHQGRGLRLVETASPIGQPPGLRPEPVAGPGVSVAERPDEAPCRRVGRGGECAPALRLCTGSRRLLRDGVVVPLTRREFDLFQFFCEHPRRVFSRAQLLRHVWGYDMVGTERTVDVHVRRLRVKLAGCAPIIATVRGVGYRLDDDAQVEVLIEDK